MADEDTPTDTAQNPAQDPGPDGGGVTLAERVDRLFRTARRPDGRTYSNADVARELTALGVAVSAPYLWQLRTGRRTNPTLRHLQALVRFFQVDPAYFFPTEAGPGPEVAAAELAGALRRAGVRELALSAAGLSTDTLDALGAVVHRVRTLEGLDPLPAG